MLYKIAKAYFSILSLIKESQCHREIKLQYISPYHLSLGNNTNKAPHCIEAFTVIGIALKFQQFICRCSLYIKY